eukprot:918737-Lingulodinium_polyedra.AAC.1
MPGAAGLKTPLGGRPGICDGLFAHCARGRGTGQDVGNQSDAGYVPALQAGVQEHAQGTALRGNACPRAQ